MANLEAILADLTKGAEQAGAHVEFHRPGGVETKLASVGASTLQGAYVGGAKAAATHFKVAFAPLVAAGLSALAPAAARGLMGKVAPRALGAIAKPVAGALFDTGTQMAAQKALS
jgi:hypothetical protein